MPNVVIRDGTVFDPIIGAMTTLAVQTIAMDTFGNAYKSAPTVDITDSTDKGTCATDRLSPM